MSLAERRVWTDAELEADRQRAINIFRDERLKESLEDYLEAFEAAQGSTENLLETTVDLTHFADALDFLTDKELLDSFRYIAGPPISEADLETLSDATLAPTLFAEDPDRVRRVIETVMIGLDRKRFAWISEKREPSPEERRAAVLATASVMASQKVRTKRSNENSQLQEQAVRDALVYSGFDEVDTGNITPMNLRLEPGQFCSESLVGSRKADIPIRLWDGRVMPVECKVSNSGTNSIKRLNNDAAVKAKRWIDEFGNMLVIPTAVISGVFKMKNLKDAQDDGLTIYWAHSLDQMMEWIEQTRKN